MFFQQLINGLMLGSTYSLIAMGYTLVLGLLQMLNLAHGDVFMFGAFLGLTFAFLGIPLYLALLLAMIGAGLLSILVERFCFRPLRKAHFLSPLLSTIAFGILLQNVGTQIWGSEPSRYPQTSEIAQFQFGPILFSSIHLIILVTSLALMVGIDQFVRRTRMGRAMRATSEGQTNASLLGVDVNPGRHLHIFFFRGLGRSGRGVDRPGLPADYPFHRNPPGPDRDGGHGHRGLGQSPGSHDRGILIGLIEVMNDAYFTASYRDIIIYGIFFLFLMFKPEGLFSMNKRES